MESHSGSILVKASIDELADAFASVALETRLDVLGLEIEVAEFFFLTYQIVGQQWSGVLGNQIWYVRDLERCSRPNAAQISQLVGQPTIDFEVSDTVGCIGYKLFEAGELIEYFSGSEESDPGNEAGIEAQYYEFMPYPDEPSVQRARFWSRDRQLTAEEIGNIWRFPHQFLCDQVAYEPAIDTRYFLHPAPEQGKGRCKVENRGITSITSRRREVTVAPELIRVDYFGFGT
jgi:hypothetical protein